MPHLDPAKSNFNHQRHITIMGKMGLETPGKHPSIPNLALCAKNKPLKGNVSFQKNTFFWWREWHILLNHSQYEIKEWLSQFIHARSKPEMFLKFGWVKSVIKSETVNQHLSVSASNKISDYIPILWVAILWTIRKRGELSSYDVVFTFVRIEVRMQMVQWL